MLLEFDCELELEVFLLLVCFGCGVPLLTLEAVPQAPKRRPSGKIAPTNHRDVFIAAPFLGTPIGHYDNRNYTLRQPQLHTTTTAITHCNNSPVELLTKYLNCNWAKYIDCFHSGIK